jgi:Immune inhibitor A peptidase M6
MGGGLVERASANNQGGRVLRRRIFPFFVGLGLLVGLLLPAAGFSDEPKKNALHSADDVLHVGPDLNGGEALPLASTMPVRQGPARSQFGTQSHGDPAVGESFVWAGLDSVAGLIVLKFYTLRAIGTHAEVWVANNLNFPTGDCRNDGVRNVVTQAQVDYLLDEFDTNIFPKESAAFSVAPDRDGTNEVITSLVPEEIAALMHPQGAGDRTVVLIDNVRDENYFDPNNSQGFSYIAGFFSSQFNDLFDRNIMTIDSWDWVHRTGANPPHEPVPGNFCTSAAARPFLYEGVFAHEYQHLLEHYEDGDEVNWINEGLADWAQTLTGYVNPATPIDQLGFDAHVQCFLGWLAVQTEFNPNPDPSGPENSLTLWEDQGDDEILCDYGATYTMMELLHGRYGDDFMSALHRHDANGLAGLQAVLTGEGNGKIDVRQVLHDWQLMVAVDALLDDGASISGKGVRKGDLTVPTLDASINWDSPDAFSEPGAPPNGADYVRLRNAGGAYLRGRDINSIAFQGATQIAPKPLQWTVDANPPGQTGDAALYSGSSADGGIRDEMAVRSVAVPTGAGAELTFNARWNLELGWDFGYVQVSTDGGSTYTSLECTDTTEEHDPGAVAEVVAQLPGFTGDSGGFVPQECSLAPYAGSTVLLAFRAINDPLVEGQNPAVRPGFWVDDVTVGGELISDGSSLEGWQSATQARPTSVENFTVYLLSVRDRGQQAKITLRQLPLTSDFSVDRKVENYVDKQAEFVAAIVIYDESTESSVDYAPYRLTVNGVVQPGGGM